jgi:isoleucyl-tRNA synthetase
MINKNSIHLQDFPDVSFINDNEQIISDMDIIRNICATALFIRDQRNLRVRLPLNKVTIFNYGGNEASFSNIKNNESYQNLIKDELNVKNIEVIEIEEGNKDVAELKLQLNFKKIGASFGAKMKEISKNAQQGNWQKIDENSIKIGDLTLKDDDFEIKLIAKDANSSASLSTNDCVVQLDINVTQDLEDEGLARDVIRTIQQNRRSADLNVSDHINVVFYSKDQRINKIIKSYDQNIKEQILANDIELIDNSEAIESYIHKFENDIDEIKIKIAFNKI